VLASGALEGALIMIRLIGLDAIKHHVAPAFWTRRMQDRNRIRSMCLITHMRIPRV